MCWNVESFCTPATKMGLQMMFPLMFTSPWWVHSRSSPQHKWDAAVAVGQNRYLVVLEKNKEREPWKSRKLRCQFGIVSLFLYCFTLRENEMWTDLQWKQVTRTYIISQRFCKEVEKLQIIFRHQLDQCRLRGWFGCMRCEKLH